MDENILPDYLVDDKTGFEVDLPVACYTDSIHLGRNVASLGQIGKP